MFYLNYFTFFSFLKQLFNLYNQTKYLSTNKETTQRFDQSLALNFLYPVLTIEHFNVKDLHTFLFWLKAFFL